MSYTFSLSRRSLPVRCLCLLLAVLVLWCFFMVPRAGAVATEAATVAYAGALIGTILVGAGVVFSSHGDMQAVGAAMYKSWIKSSNAIGSAISGIASWALEHGEAVAKGALRVGKDMYQAVVDAFNASYSNGVFSFDNTITDSSAFSAFFAAHSFMDSFWLRAPYTSDLISWRGLSFDSSEGVYDYQLKILSSMDDDGNLSFGVTAYRYRLGLEASSRAGSVAAHLSGNPTLDSYKWYVDSGKLYLQYLYTPRAGSYAGRQQVGDMTVLYGLPGEGELFYIGLNRMISSIPVTVPDLVYPSDDYLVRMPDIPSVDTATGAATFPSDAAYTKDAVAVPYPVDTEGVKVPDIPYDKVVDQSTGKTLDDADTGTDTKPGEGTGEGTETGSGVSGLIGTIIGLLKNFFDSPSDFKLDMDGFRNLAIADKFPFCIPFDMVDSVKQFAATAADYQFRIKFDTQYFSVDHTVDLTPIAVPLAFFRYIVCVWFVWVLMSRTHDLMKW